MTKKHARQMRAKFNAANKALLKIVALGSSINDQIEDGAFKIHDLTRLCDLTHDLSEEANRLWDLGTEILDELEAKEVEKAKQQEEE